MDGRNHFGENLESAHKGERFGDPILQLLVYSSKNLIPKLYNIGLERKRDAQKMKDFTMLNPLPLILLKPSMMRKGRLPVTKGFVPLNRRP